MVLILQGLFNEVVEILSFMEADGVAPTAQSYGAVFEGVERSQLVDKVAALKEYLPKMEAQVSFNYYTISDEVRLSLNFPKTTKFLMAENKNKRNPGG